MADRPSISLTVLDNGPYKLSPGSDGDALRFRYAGEALEVEPGEDVYLCRCGRTGNAPFCDGSHERTGFVAEAPDANAKEIRVWEGRRLRTFFNPNACMHVFYCKPLKELRERELAGDDAAGVEIAKVVMSCPSGALTFEEKQGAQEDPAVPTAEAAKPAYDADVDIVEGAEIRIQCDLEIGFDRHERQPGDRATFCRCGLSKNKPWCDGRHRKRDDGFR